MKYPREDWMKRPGGIAPFLTFFTTDVPADELRDALVTSALYTIAYEYLYHVAVRTLRGLFETGMDKDYVFVSDDYESEVLALDPEGRRREWIASLKWFEKQGAIGAEDVAQFEDLRKARNELAHNLAQLQPEFDSGRYTALFKFMLKLMGKVDTWWQRNVNLPLSLEHSALEGQPDFASVESSLPKFLGLVHDIVLEHHPMTKRRLEGLFDPNASGDSK